VISSAQSELMGDKEVMGLEELREQAVWAELDRVLGSAAFRTSKRSREFLEYIVEHTLNGPRGTLKERSIGVGLFRLQPDFDTGQHTIVRVTANEVRKRLAQHYLAENGSSHVRIELPPGSYSAEFRWETAAAETQPSVETQNPGENLVQTESQAVTEEPATVGTEYPEALVGGRVRWFRPVWAGVAISILIVAAVVFLALPASKPVTREAKPAATAGPLLKGLPGGGDLRLAVGAASPYTDRDGRTWGPDQFFAGGSVLARPAQRILRTLDPDIYRRFRQGEFHYDIPLKPGSYELHLHFAETGLADFISAESSGEGQRLFRVTANGNPILDYFDVVADAAGANISDERVFGDISPAQDGFLHLGFAAVRGTAMVSGIEVLPVSPGKVRPVRIRAGWTASWQDSAGQQWQADSYFMGGNALVRTANPARDSNSNPTDIAVYSSERWGHFSYAVPVAEGRYRVTLKFCEGHYGKRNTGVGGLGSRVFDVYCNGVALLRDFDIFREAGGEGRPLDRIFSGVRPTAQGKIVLTFVPVKGMACVNAIEVAEEPK